MPDGLNFVNAASAVLSGIRAYTALHYLYNLCQGETVLITRGALGISQLAVQLAGLLKARVYTTVHSDEELNVLQDFPTEIGI
jgi:NADPH:quinone reductase-like Zn-dependent oxidoreductase